MKKLSLLFFLLLALLFTFEACNNEEEETPAPTITNLSPLEFTLAAGATETLTITGTNFGTDQSAVSVTLGGSSLSVQSVTDTRIQAGVTASASSGTVTVSVNGKSATSSQSVTINQAPVISDFSPKSGGPGTEVTITGSNFTADAKVTFADNKDAVVTFVSATELKATVPADAVTGKIKVSIGNVEVESAADFEVVNAPPAAFGLVAVADEATEVDLTPTFEWEAATDPEGGDVTYDLYLDTSDDPATTIASDLTGTTFELTERLSLIENYSWKVIAKDAEGNETSSDVFSFETRTIRFPAQAVTEDAAFGERNNHASAVFDGKIWVVGGSNNSGVLNSVWNSSDGENWNLVNENSDFEKRSRSELIVFNNKLWLIGGTNFNNIRLGDIWSSSDGSNWTLEKDSTSFSPRINFSAIVFDNKLWLIGGNGTSSTGLSEVWNSTNGRDWTLVTASVNFGRLTNHTSLVYDGKIWVIGGAGNDSGADDDVWYSSDGVSWTQATDNAAFGRIRRHTSVVYDNKMWVIGGVDSQSKRINNVWFSEDGETWTEALQDIPFTPRDRHTSEVYDDKVWIISGIDETGVLSDVWYFE